MIIKEKLCIIKKCEKFYVKNVRKIHNLNLLKINGTSCRVIYLSYNFKNNNRAIKLASLAIIVKDFEPVAKIRYTHRRIYALPLPLNKYLILSAGRAKRHM